MIVGVDDASEGVFGKVIRLADALLERWARALSSGSSEATLERVIPQAAAFDREVALAQIEGDQELFDFMAEVFLRECPKQFASMAQAFKDGDPERVCRAAHTIRGSAGGFAARTVLDAVFAIEQGAKKGELGNLEEELLTLSSELERLCVALREPS